MKLAFLWHFHQPIYRHPETGRYVFPWVLYHSLKNYHQMAVIAGSTEFKSNFNFVPCLIEQIQDYADGKADDPWLEALKKRSEELTENDLELLKQLIKEDISEPEKLQIAALKSMFSPSENSDKKSKEELMSDAERIIDNLLPHFKKLEKSGLAELTTSPYYHPLLPAICDLKSTDEDFPLSIVFQYPEDARLQLEKGKKLFTSVFGHQPRGLWPSEGAVSKDAVNLVAEAGFDYIVTDENVLEKSLKRKLRAGELYKAYSVSGIEVFFRQRFLSDSISFTYQGWLEEEAVNHFLVVVNGLNKLLPEEAVLVIALDGENPWAYYRQNGFLFLKLLFSKIKEQKEFEVVLLSEITKTNKNPKEIDLASGTWMGNFSKWVGHPDKNSAWQALARARLDCGPSEEILIAEGSDWFWWAGEPEDEKFRPLFQAFIHRAYQKKAGAKNG